VLLKSQLFAPDVPDLSTRVFTPTEFPAAFTSSRVEETFPAMTVVLSVVSQLYSQNWGVGRVVVVVVVVVVGMVVVVVLVVVVLVVVVLVVVELVVVVVVVEVVVLDVVAAGARTFPAFRGFTYALNSIGPTPSIE
jgi:hypothetical protein